MSSATVSLPTTTAGKKPYDINLRMCISFREIGIGYAGLETFNFLANMLPPMTKFAYENIKSDLYNAYLSAAQDSMKSAADEIRNLKLGKENDINDVAQCRVSLDGTWQKRGYSSLNGVVTVIATDSGKCIDTDVLSKHCNSCKIWEREKDSPQYDEWKESHDCRINHTGSSGSMESSGAVKMFNRSVQFNKLQYVEYLGDGDTSSFHDVQLSNPYPGITMKKLECVGHVQKRVGTRLRNMKKAYKGIKLKDGKPLTGKNRLTEKVINTLQNYYGMAIRQNKGKSVYEMKKSVGAILFHCSEASTEDNRHIYCPHGTESWCKWQKNQALGNTLGVLIFAGTNFREFREFRDFCKT